MVSQSVSQIGLPPYLVYGFADGRVRGSDADMTAIAAEYFGFTFQLKNEPFWAKSVMVHRDGVENSKVGPCRASKSRARVGPGSARLRLDL